MKDISLHTGRLCIQKRLKNSVQGNPRFSLYLSHRDRDGRLLSPGIEGYAGPLSVRKMLKHSPVLDRDAAIKLCEPIDAGLAATECLTQVASHIARDIESLEGAFVQAHIGTHYVQHMAGLGWKGFDIDTTITSDG